ncbi:MAG: hypothetical protein LBR37_00090 [Erysipelotrichaceae bacterium]|jgi:hypothetical protein|nr:hypothetical protein [Erysipelotrichaceae bacterium]
MKLKAFLLLALPMVLMVTSCQPKTQVVKSSEDVYLEILGNNATDESLNYATLIDDYEQVVIPDGFTIMTSYLSNSALLLRETATNRYAMLDLVDGTMTASYESRQTATGVNNYFYLYNAPDATLMVTYRLYSNSGNFITEVASYGAISIRGTITPQGLDLRLDEWIYVKVDQSQGVFYTYSDEDGYDYLDDLSELNQESKVPLALGDLFDIGGTEMSLDEYGILNYTLSVSFINQVYPMIKVKQPSGDTLTIMVKEITNQSQAFILDTFVYFYITTNASEDNHMVATNSTTFYNYQVVRYSLADGKREEITTDIFFNPNDIRELYYGDNGHVMYALVEGYQVVNKTALNYREIMIDVNVKEALDLSTYPVGDFYRLSDTRTMVIDDNNSLSYLINEDGAIVTTLPDNYTFSNGVISFSQNGRYGAVDLDGKVIIPFEYQSPIVFYADATTTVAQKYLDSSYVILGKDSQETPLVVSSMLLTYPLYGLYLINDNTDTENPYQLLNGAGVSILEFNTYTSNAVNTDELNGMLYLTITRQVIGSVTEIYAMEL